MYCGVSCKRRHSNRFVTSVGCIYRTYRTETGAAHDVWYGVVGVVWLVWWIISLLYLSVCSSLAIIIVADACFDKCGCLSIEFGCNILVVIHTVYHFFLYTNHRFLVSHEQPNSIATRTLGLIDIRYDHVRNVVPLSHT